MKKLINKIGNWIRINLTDTKLNKYIQDISTVIEQLLTYERDVEKLMLMLGLEELIPDQVQKVRVLLTETVMELNKGKTVAGREELTLEMGSKILCILDKGRMGNPDVYLGIIKRVIKK